MACSDITTETTTNTLSRVTYDTPDAVILNV